VNDLIYTEVETLNLLDVLLVNRERDWWDGFYQDRAKPCPFFVDLPDESLAQWIDEGLLRPGSALDS
jgi:hypothetical protein